MVPSKFQSPRSLLIINIHTSYSLPHLFFQATESLSSTLLYLGALFTDLSRATQAYHQMLQGTHTPMLVNQPLLIHPDGTRPLLQPFMPPMPSFTPDDLQGDGTPGDIAARI